MTTSLDTKKTMRLEGLKKEFGSEAGSRLSEFAIGLEDLGVFSRSYDSENLKELYTACEIIHKHLCRLDSYNLQKLRALGGVTLIEFVNEYARVCVGLREF